MKKFSNWLYKLSAGWVALAALLGFVLFTALVLPGQAQQAEAYSSEAGSPDTSLFYTADQLYSFAESYGAQGRQAYIRARLSFDVVWPLVYTVFLVTSISWLSQKIKPNKPWVGCLNLVPIFALLFDFLENASTVIVMLRYPSKTAVLASLAGALTAAKWGLVGGSFLILFILAVLALVDRVRKRG